MRAMQAGQLVMPQTSSRAKTRSAVPGGRPPASSVVGRLWMSPLMYRTLGGVRWMSGTGDRSMP
jgi:hypothetical protein